MQRTLKKGQGWVDDYEAGRVLGFLRKSNQQHPNVFKEFALLVLLATPGEDGKVRVVFPPDLKESDTLKQDCLVDLDGSVRDVVVRVTRAAVTLQATQYLIDPSPFDD